MLIYYKNLYHIIDHEAYLTAQVNLIKNEKNIYHNVSNQLNVEKTVQKKDDVKNEINFNENAVKIANFVVVNSKSVSLKICHKCQAEFNTENQLHCYIK